MSGIKKDIIVSKTIRKTINFTDKVLEVLYGIGEVIDSFTIKRSDISNALNVNFGGYDWSKTKPSKLLNNLERQGYIKRSETAQNSVEFTSKAKLKIIDKISGKKKTDGKFRFISFDIPEEKRRARNAFRRAIKRIGFVQIQKSLWVCNKNVGDLVELASYEYKVEKYVIYIVSEKTDVDGIIGRKF